MTQTAEPPAAAVPARPAKVRDPFLDNAKFLAIILVVSGHLIEDLRDVEAARAVYLWVYMFHMPVFIVITGYLSRSFTFSSGKARKLITNLLLPFVIFELAYSIFNWLAGNGSLRVSLLDPYYLTWFLMALFAWRLSTPVWQQVKWPVAVAVVIALLSGTSELPRELELNRVFGLLPFYVLGLFLKPEHLELVKRPIARYLGIAVLLGALVVAALVHRRMNIVWVYWRHSNDFLGVSDLVGTLMRMGLLLCAMILVFAFLAVVPTGFTWFSSLGSATLYAYLLHGFVVKAFDYLGWYDLRWLHTELGVASLWMLGVAISIGFCTNPAKRAFGWAVEPKMPWFFTPLTKPKRN
ncbi:acyltransferase family protein [Rhizohabitans arisaemae]|uniref:acyltransferase family protein n=1 Tax=Rhizohabitans arisaemae TaxID=2720610 RepID=UPI0024B0A5A2|nr:acyltransferase family protein [Rhizohabitans arisaemae]